MRTYETRVEGHCQRNDYGTNEKSVVKGNFARQGPVRSNTPVDLIILPRPARPDQCEMMRLLALLCALTAASCSFLGGSAPALRTARPALPAARFASMQAEAAAPSEDEKPLQSAKPVGPLSKLKESLPPAKELKKVLPLGLMFFFILFAYTILRDTKDVHYASALALATATATVALAAYQPATATAQPTTTAALADQPVGTATDAVATAP